MVLQIQSSISVTGLQERCERQAVVVIDGSNGRIPKRSTVALFKIPKPPNRFIDGVSYDRDGKDHGQQTTTGFPGPSLLLRNSFLSIVALVSQRGG